MNNNSQFPHNSNNYADLGISEAQFNNYVKMALTSIIIDNIKKSNNPKTKLYEILDDKLASKNVKQIANDLLCKLNK